MSAQPHRLALEFHSPLQRIITYLVLPLFEQQVECVLLNACYSEKQALAIHQHINHVIGMGQAIGDRAAIEFAKGFYEALGANRSYAVAFEFGLSAIDLEGIPEIATPKLKQRDSSPSSIDSKPDESVPKPDLTEGLEIPGFRSRIFISYKRGISPDEDVALAIFKALSQHHDVFIDQTMAVGTPWAKKIEEELQRSDFLISFLSPNSVSSEMVRGEIETAHRLEKQQGKPKILPVRLKYREPFTYPLSAYLNSINWAFWDDSADTSRLIEELMRAIAGQALPVESEASKRDLITEPLPCDSGSVIPEPPPYAQPVSLEPAEGTMDPESKFYVERSSDSIALATIGRQGVTLTIKGPRQMGKSSLLMRAIDAAIKANKQVAYLDFQLFDQDIFRSADTFYRQFCTNVTEQLGVVDRVEDYWQEGSGNTKRCTSYIQNYILKQAGGPLVLAMDEVDRMFDANYRDDFFGMLRHWHNNRANPMLRIWKQFDLALVTATEPYHLIANMNQSPFNVGEVVELEDFTPIQVSDLNQRHGKPLTPDQERQLMALLNGHPYLVRRALYLVASQQLGVNDLFAQASADRGPFGDHLRYHLFRIYDKQELVQGLLQVIHSNTCSDERIARLLLAAGLVRREGQRKVPRCQLYKDYFREHLND